MNKGVGARAWVTVVRYSSSHIPLGLGHPAARPLHQDEQDTTMKSTLLKAVAAAALVAVSTGAFAIPVVLDFDNRQQAERGDAGAQTHQRKRTELRRSDANEKK